jgi:hypothetical protein
LFRIFPQNFIRGNAATNNTPNEEKKNRGKVKSKGYSVLCVFTKNIAQKPVEGRETVEEAFSCTPPEIVSAAKEPEWITFQKP